MKTNVKSSSGQSCYICSRKQKIFAWIALIGIFLCGMMTGVSMWGYKHAHTADSGVYSVKMLPCEMREKALLANLSQDIDDTWPDAANFHKRNADIYDNLVRAGCDENKEKYKELRDAEFSVYDVLRHNGEYLRAVQGQPCQVIESTLLGYINDCPESNCHLHNAEIYSKLVEDGCPENQQKYAKKALDELQIAEGVRVEENDVNKNEMRSTVNTYKKLQMQNEAKNYIKKVEKLVDPGVDFIMELQRVIEE